ncbi:MAG: hypothetical protein JRK53_19355 [Deltaproteobacteria bacterium]|nr:hypothetical protein [Deltaproteobacteria bacterium]
MGKNFRKFLERAGQSVDADSSGFIIRRIRGKHALSSKGKEYEDFARDVAYLMRHFNRVRPHMKSDMCLRFVVKGVEIEELKPKKKTSKKKS